MNHGIFLCANCALGIHIEHYPVEVSFIKSLTEDNFNYLQLRVLINGGNKAALDFFSVYDLQNDTCQKRYNTVAAQYYRDKLKNALDTGISLPFTSNTVKDPPFFDEGRQALKVEKKQTPQVKVYADLNNKDILAELLTWEHV